MDLNKICLEKLCFGTCRLKVV